MTWICLTGVSGCLIEELELIVVYLLRVIRHHQCWMDGGENTCRERDWSYAGDVAAVYQ